MTSNGDDIFREFCRMATPGQLRAIIAKEEEEAKTGLSDRARCAQIAREVATERGISRG